MTKKIEGHDRRWVVTKEKSHDMIFHNENY